MVKPLPTMQETQVRSLGWEDPLEKEMASHSSTLAWKIPWTEEPGRLRSMGSQRVRHDWATSLQREKKLTRFSELQRGFQHFLGFKEFKESHPFFLLLLLFFLLKVLWFGSDFSTIIFSLRQINYNHWMLVQRSDQSPCLIWKKKRKKN